LTFRRSAGLLTLSFPPRGSALGREGRRRRREAAGSAILLERRDDEQGGSGV